MKTAIIIGFGAYNDLGMCRSCGQAGMDVILLAPGCMVVPIYRSRYVSRWFDVDTDNESAVMHALEEIAADAKPGTEMFVFPTGDPQALIVDNNRDCLANFITQGADVPLSVLMDKWEMVKIATAAGMCLPESVKSDIEDIDVSALKYPCIVKPLASVLGEKGDITVCHTAGGMNKALEKFREHHTSHVLIQEYIHADGMYEIAVPGVAMPDGRVITTGYVNKHRTYGNGSTVYATFIPDISSDLAKTIETFIRKCGFHGIFDFEFIVANGKYYFIECNFRNGAYGYAATRAGLNLPALFAGINTKATSIRKVTFMEERTDILNALQGSVSKFKWLWQMLSADTLLWWNWRDPKPTLAHYWDKLRRIFN